MSDPLDPRASHLTAQDVDATLRRLAREGNRHEHVVMGWLLRADELQVERLFGYASIREYGERLFGWTGRGVEDRLRVARALADLPRLNEAFARGELVYSVVRELCRVATPETEVEWIADAEGKRAREVQREVAARSVGDRPSDPADESLVPRRVTLTLSPDAFALLESARGKAIAERGEHVDDSGFVREVMLAYLAGGGERDAGTAAFQIAMTVGPDGRARMHTGAEDVAVDDVVLQMARCDAQEVGVVDDGVAPRATQTVPPKTRRQVMLRHGGRCAVPGCSHAAFAQVHHVVPRADGGGHDPDGLVALCSAHHDAVHRGALVVTGTFSAGFGFRHADGREYGSPHMCAARSAVMAEAFAALRGLGFRETETRQMLDGVRSELAGEARTPDVVRLALRRTRVQCGVVREAVVPYLRAV
ncbi:MAG: HNH endonuclease [Sandaracinaceae bacterium]